MDIANFTMHIHRANMKLIFLQPAEVDRRSLKLDSLSDWMVIIIKVHTCDIKAHKQEQNIHRRTLSMASGIVSVDENII